MYNFLQHNCYWSAQSLRHKGIVVLKSINLEELTERERERDLAPADHLLLRLWVDGLDEEFDLDPLPPGLGVRVVEEEHHPTAAEGLPVCSYAIYF